MTSNISFSRFNNSILNDALYKKFITMDEYTKINMFWGENILFNISDEDKNFLKLLKFEFENYDEDKIKIISYPHLKLMCLKVYKQDPKFWIYEDETDGNYLFGLIIFVNKCQIIKTEKEFYDCI